MGLRLRDRRGGRGGVSRGVPRHACCHRAGGQRAGGDGCRATCSKRGARPDSRGGGVVRGGIRPRSHHHGRHRPGGRMDADGAPQRGRPGRRATGQRSNELGGLGSPRPCLGPCARDRAPRGGGTAAAGPTLRGSRRPMVRPGACGRSDPGPCGVWTPARTTSLPPYDRPVASQPHPRVEEGGPPGAPKCAGPRRRGERRSGVGGALGTNPWGKTPFHAVVSLDCRGCRRGRLPWRRRPMAAFFPRHHRLIEK